MDDAATGISYATYVAREAVSEVRHEYIGGRVTARTGDTIERGRLIGRLAMLLGRALDGRAGVVLPSSVRVRIRAADCARYPDLQVVCHALERAPDDHATVNPTAIFEVLPAATAASARGDAFADYRRLLALREYVLVSQRERRVDVYRRDGRRWHLDEFGPGERVAVESLAIELAVDELYVDGLGPIVAAGRPARRDQERARRAASTA